MKTLVAQRVADRHVAARKHYRLDRALITRTLRNLNDPESRLESKQVHGGYSDYSLAILPLRDVVVPPVWHPRREDAIRKAIQTGKALPPIRASREGAGKWEISDDIHRSNVSKQMGFTHIPAIVSVWVETPDEEIPEALEKPQLQIGDWVRLHKPEQSSGKKFEFGYIDELLGFRIYRGVRRYRYGVALVTSESDWPDVYDLSDTDFEPVRPPSWGPEVRRNMLTR